MMGKMCLEGIRIIDMSRVLALPLATMILSDLGAEVIKIESPNSGDETRGWGPPYLGEDSAYYLCVNRNKKSITLDIKTEHGQNLVHSLLKEADVFVENFKPGVLKRYNLDYESVTKTNPKIIYCSLSGFGQDSPNLPGYDFIIQGLSGLMSITGEPEGEPMKVGVAITDVVAGLYATVAILAALFGRSRDREGEYIDIALYDTAIASLVNVASNYLVSGTPPKRYGNAHPNIVPYQTFMASDRYFNVAIGNDNQWKRFVELVKEPKLRKKKFSTNADRVRNRKELIPILNNVFKRKTASEWIKLLRKSSIPCGEINTLVDVFNDPHIKKRNLITAIKHPRDKHLELKLVSNPIKFKKHLIKPPEYPPSLGEHNEEILTKLSQQSSES